MYTDRYEYSVLLSSIKRNSLWTRYENVTSFGAFEAQLIPNDLRNDHKTEHIF